MRTIVIILGALLLCGACSSRGVDPLTEDAQWTLARMELDRSLLGNLGALPTFQAPAGAVGAGIPRAKGTLHVNDYGKVACEISVFEPVVALGGTRAVIEHRLVRFYGRMVDGGRLFVREDRNQSSRLGDATVLHAEQQSDGYVRLTAATGSKKLPYVYWFRPGARPAPPINIPYHDG